MPTQTKIIVVILAVLILGTIGFAVLRNNMAPKGVVGGDRDAHGCIGSAGYSWCETKQKCLRVWEEKCEPANNPGKGNGLSEAEARAIAEKTCIKSSELSTPGYYNENSKTWWFDANVNATRSGCNPACVVSEATKTAEINWRCTGAIPPPTEPGVIACLPEQRNTDMCIELYQPVCATVGIQCIKAPCDPIRETYSNSCNACKNPLVRSYIVGNCGEVGIR